MAREKQAADDAAEAEEIKVKKQSLEMAEDIDEDEVDKSKKGEVKLHKLREEKSEVKPKRVRKTITKKS